MEPGDNNTLSLLAKYGDISIGKLVEEYDRVVSEKTDLEARVVELEDKLSFAQRSKKTMLHIAQLEEDLDREHRLVMDTMRALNAANDTIDALMRERSAATASVEASKKLNSRLDYMAQKLGVKRGSRTDTELLQAIEDAIRRLV